MSNPRFPDPFGRRELLEPGATASGGGLSLEQRVAALEMGASARPGPNVADGSVKTADSGTVGKEVWRAPPLHLVHSIVRRNTFAGITGATNFFLTLTGLAFGSTAGSTSAIFYLDPDDVTKAGVLEFQVFLRAWVITETNPTDSTLTIALNQVTGVGAGGTIASIGADVVSCTMTPNAATTAYAAESSFAAVSSAGFYVVRFNHTVDPAQSMSYAYSVHARAA